MKRTFLLSILLILPILLFSDKTNNTEECFFIKEEKYTIRPYQETVMVNGWEYEIINKNTYEALTGLKANTNKYVALRSNDKLVVSYPIVDESSLSQKKGSVQGKHIKSDSNIPIISAFTLSSEFQDNSIRAKNKYDNKNLTISLKVANIEENLYWESHYWGYVYSIDISMYRYTITGSTYPTITIFLQNTEQDKVLNISTGDIITINGRLFYEKLTNSILILDAVFVE